MKATNRYICIYDFMLALKGVSTTDLLALALIFGYTQSKGFYCGSAQDIASRISREYDDVVDSISYLTEEGMVQPYADRDGNPIGYKSLVDFNSVM